MSSGALEVFASGELGVGEEVPVDDVGGTG
jgi:hypothetical protein